MITKDLLGIVGVAGKISVTYDNSKYEVHDLSLSPNGRIVAKGKPSKIKIANVMAYFRVTGPNDNNKKNKFNPPLKFKIAYSRNDWNQALINNKHNSYKRPRIAYLDGENNNWAASWEEFKSANIRFIKPGTGGDPNGYLEITIKELPDPLIGGC